MVDKGVRQCQLHFCEHLYDSDDRCRAEGGIFLCTGLPVEAEHCMIMGPICSVIWRDSPYLIYRTCFKYYAKEKSGCLCVYWGVGGGDSGRVLHAQGVLRFG